MHFLIYLSFLRIFVIFTVIFMCLDLVSFGEKSGVVRSAHLGQTPRSTFMHEGGVIKSSDTTPSEAGLVPSLVAL